MLSRPAARRTDIKGTDAEEGLAEDPVLRSVLTAPVRPGQAPEWEAEVLEQAAAASWSDGVSVSAEIAARARRGQ
jgi:hypothetical protein